MSFLKKLFGRKTETPVAETPQQPVEEAIKEVEDHPLPEASKEGSSACEEEAKEEPEVAVEEEAKEEPVVVVEEEPKEEPEVVVEEEAKEEPEVVVEEEAKEEPEVVTEEEAKEELVVVAEEATKEEPAVVIEEELKEEPKMVIEEAVKEESAPVEEPKKKKGFFSKLVEGLSKTRDQFIGTVDEVLKGFKKIDEDLYEELEEVLIMADFGVDTTLAIMTRLREIVKERKITEPEMLKDTLKEVITNILTKQEVTPIIDETKQNVVLVIGVNGVGKTTTIGKLANQFKNDNKKVVLAAADTFRAAAIDQLAIWANRAGVDLIKHDEGTDPAAVVFDGVQAAKARKADVLICDTAGRLQNKTNLMKELEKIGRIIDREYPDAHKEVLIVLDATTGQNAISQVKVFKEVAKVDGIILTKLDGTAKGGAIVGICESLQVPVKYIGVGEKIEDLQVFDPQAFADALFAKSQK